MYQRLGGSVSLSQAFPRRQFTEEDMSSTFADLQLAPSAVVLALPVCNTTNLFLVSVSQNFITKCEKIQVIMA